MGLYEDKESVRVCVPTNFCRRIDSTARSFFSFFCVKRHYDDMIAIAVLCDNANESSTLLNNIQSLFSHILKLLFTVECMRARTIASATECKCECARVNV